MKFLAEERRSAVRAPKWIPGSEAMFAAQYLLTRAHRGLPVIAWVLIQAHGRNEWSQNLPDPRTIEHHAQ